MGGAEIEVTALKISRHIHILRFVILLGLNGEESFLESLRLPKVITFVAVLFELAHPFDHGHLISRDILSVPVVEAFKEVVSAVALVVLRLRFGA